MTWFGWALAGWFAYGAVTMVARVGKPREPIAPIPAAIGVIVSALLIVLVLISGTGTGL